MPGRWWGCILLVLAAASASAQPAPAQLFEQGAQAFASGDFAGAENALRRVVRQQPASFEANFLLGATLVQLGKIDDAIRFLGAAHKLNPRHPDALKLLAAQRMIKRDYAPAIAVLQPAAVQGRADEEIYLLLVEALLGSGDVPGSFDFTQRAVKLFPSSPAVNCWMGFQLQFSARYDEARQYLEKAIRLDASYPATYYVLGDVLLKQEKFAEAVPLFRKAIEAKPDDSDARLGLGQALTGANRLREAVAALEEAARVTPGEARIHLQLSRLYFRLGDEERAQREAEITVKMRPGQPSLLTDIPNALRGPR